MNNKDKVFIKIRGLYTGAMDSQYEMPEEEIDVETKEDETVEIINVGTYSVVNGKEYIRYEEVYDESKESSTSMIKIYDNCVEVSKKGAVTTKMIFKPGDKTMTFYNTPYGAMSLGITTKQLDIDRTDNKIEIYLVYGMELNYEHLSDCDLRITVTTEELNIAE